MYITKEILDEERRNHLISGIITAILAVLFIVAGFIWTGFRMNVPPPGDIEYEVVGAIDFGDYKMGSKDINTLEESKPDPAPAAKEVVAAPVKEAEVKETEPDPVPPVTQQTPSPVTVPKVETKPKKEIPTEPEKVKDKSEPVKEPTKNDTGKAQEEVKVEDPKPNADAKPTGSNQGNADNATGNAGLPDAKEFDDRYAFEWGSSSGEGAGARSPLKMEFPAYTVQEEGVLTFEFTIKPDGTVANVRLKKPTMALGLKRAGVEAIRGWQFTPLPSGKSYFQTVQVSITFKLKG